jgi:Exopolysaccharide biosynthesis protein YbjH
MSNKKNFFTTFFLMGISFAAMPALGDEQIDLLQDLLIVDAVNQQINDRFPVTFDHFLQGGYINMPSARMGNSGEIGIGYSHVPPYINYNLRCQLSKHLEISGNYRIFKGVEDPILSPMGFGDLSDKGANIKVALFLPEDSDYALPGIALGYEDFIGTQNFRTKYVVATQVFLNYDTEISLGIGNHRIKGLFGGINWMPFRRSPWNLLRTLCFTAEYDATPYKDENIELHPRGRVKKSPINFGVKYRLWDQLDLSVSYIRGDALAVSASCFYNFGIGSGFLPKIDDPLPYQGPANTTPLGCLRPEEELVQDLICHFNEQGFDLLYVWLSYDDCANKILRLGIFNYQFREERDVKDQLNHLLLQLIPENIDQVIVTIEGEGFPVQEYLYKMDFVRLYAQGQIGLYEMDLINHWREATSPDPCSSILLFKHPRDWWNLEVYPKTLTFFGSSRGKFKYALGLHVNLNGFLYDDLYYSILLGSIFFSDLHHTSGIDRLNPSQIINVRSDIVEYYKQRGITVDEAYVQKNWNLGQGWYSSISAGLFEVEYGGVGSEILYYPVNSCWAIGIEGAFLRKRKYRGWGFSDQVRKLHGFVSSWHKFYGKQYFANFYYNWIDCELDFSLKFGKFLANDYGARFELSRYFPSGMRLSVWYTHTSAHDKINGKNYHDKGVAISLPMDIFYTYSERSHFGYGMSAWLRDVGVTAFTGRNLYDLINEHREFVR